MSSSIVQYVRLTPKGIVEKRLVNGQTFPVIGLPFWFTYSLLACTARDGNHRYNGRPNGYQIRLNVLYFCRECVIITNTSKGYRSFFAKLLSTAKSESIPSEWTEDSPARKNAALRKRFELLISDQLRLMSAQYRKERRRALKLAKEEIYSEVAESLHIPVEALEVTAEVWSEFARPTKDYIFPLAAEHLPTSQEICIAATTDTEFAALIASVLQRMQEAFEGKREYPDSGPNGSANELVSILCAIIILESIAESSPYLAALSDVEACVNKWNPVYLC